MKFFPIFGPFYVLLIVLIFSCGWLLKRTKPPKYEMRLVICNKSEMIINSLFCWSVVFMNSSHSSVVRSLLNSLEKKKCEAAMMIKQGVKYRLIFCCHFRIGTNDGSLQMIAKVVSKQLLTAIITPRIQKIRENAWGESSGTIFLSVIHLCCMTILTRAEALSCNKFFFSRWTEL